MCGVRVFGHNKRWEAKWARVRSEPSPKKKRPQPGPNGLSVSCPIGSRRACRALQCGDWQLHILLKTLDSFALEPCQLTTPRTEDNSPQSSNSMFSNRDADKEAKLTDCSFNIKQIQNILNGNIAKKNKKKMIYIWILGMGIFSHLPIRSDSETHDPIPEWFLIYFTCPPLGLWRWGNHTGYTGIIMVGGRLRFPSFPRFP